MISRNSAKAIADAYHAKFTSRHSSSGHPRRSEFTYHEDALYDFLYVNNFEAWMLNAAKKIRIFDERGLSEFLMRLHTGESLVAATRDWNWEQRRLLGQRLLRDLAQVLVRVRHTDPSFETYGNHKKDAVDAMQRQLELDGYVYRDGVLLVPEESVLDEQEEQGVLEQLVQAVELHDPETIRHHLSLSEEHYLASRWDDSVSNSRKVLEAVLQQAAIRYSRQPGPAALSRGETERPVRVREYLESEGLLEKKEKEAIGTSYGLLSNTGGHPYIAQQDQARLMRHLALTFSQFVLLRVQGALKAS